MLSVLEWEYIRDLFSVHYIHISSIFFHIFYSVNYIIYTFFSFSRFKSQILHIQHTASWREYYQKMQVSINAIRQKSSSLAWRFISSNKINVDYRYSYPKLNCMNRHCSTISNKEMPALSDTLEENKLPLVKNMIESSSKFSFHPELKRRYPHIPDGVLALYHAVLLNNSSLVRNLIKFDEVDVDYLFSPLQDSILHLASCNGCTDIVRILVEEGHASCYKNILDFYPIHYAAQNNHIDIVEYFSERSPETRALLEAVQQKNSSLVRSLIKSNKVDVNYVYFMEELYTVLHVAASEGSLEI